MTNGRRKGAKFENAIAREVTAWTGVKFTRTPSSGGWAKTGDITPKDPKEMVKFPFNLELKNNETWNLPMLFKFADTGKLPKPYSDWWKQCTDDAKKSKRIPMVVFSRSYDLVYCIMREKEFRALGLTRSASIYIRVGVYRVCLWKEVLQIPYKRVMKTVRKKK